MATPVPLDMMHQGYGITYQKRINKFKMRDILKKNCPVFFMLMKDKDRSGNCTKKEAHDN